MRKVLGIVCRQEAYTERLSEELCKELFREWQPAVFSSFSEFMHWEGSTAVRLLMLEECFAEEWKRLPEGTERPFCVWLSEEEPVEHDPGIFMYQSSEQIGRQLLEFYQKQMRGRLPPEPLGIVGNIPSQQNERASPKETEAQALQPVSDGLTVIGVLSPCGGVGVTSFAYACGKELLGKGTVLFLSLDPYPGLSEVPEDSRAVSELLYLLQEYGTGWTEKKGVCIRRQGALGVLAGMADASDLWTFGEADWSNFLEGLRKSREISFLVIDLGVGCAAREAMLRDCHRLFLLGAEDSSKVALWKRQFQRFEKHVETLPIWKNGENVRLEREGIAGCLRNAGLWKEEA